MFIKCDCGETIEVALNVTEDDYFGRLVRDLTVEIVEQDCSCALTDDWLEEAVEGEMCAAAEARAEARRFG